MNEHLPDKTEGKQKALKPQLYKPGVSGNPAGRPKGTRNYATLLEEALNEYETETGRNILRRYIERAFTNDRILISVIKKLIPDKQQLELEQPDTHSPYEHLTDEELIEKAEIIIIEAKAKMQNSKKELAEFWKPENKGKTYY